jgi:hypothetical protein
MELSEHTYLMKDRLERKVNEFNKSFTLIQLDLYHLQQIVKVILLVDTVIMYLKLTQSHGMIVVK